MKERNPYCLLAFAIVLIWALWNYNVSLKLLAGIYDVLLPFVIGGWLYGFYRQRADEEAGAILAQNF